ncbi:hypothetical protein HGA64_03740, partial [Candidatus Falkowbacteria bacterium]|nr:hypothetical protein [Candidatus Falkowbacteria bacterium]
MKTIILLLALSMPLSALAAESICKAKEYAELQDMTDAELKSDIAKLDDFYAYEDKAANEANESGNMRVAEKAMDSRAVCKEQK